MKKIATLWQLSISTVRTLRLMHSRRPAAVFSMGGYVAGPPVISALLRGTPVVIMEPNAVPGITNRGISRFVAHALINFPSTAIHFPPGRTEVTGLPVREEFFAIPKKSREEAFTMLITGGSQGSRTLNQAFRASWPLFAKCTWPVRILHQAGPAAAEQLQAEFARSGLDGIVVPFIEDMPSAFAEADLVICRSGAGAVSELAAAGKPSVLVPFPFAADQHQLKNAEAFESAGAARLVRDEEMTGEKLFAVVTELASDPGRLDEMGAAARTLARPGAAHRAADILEQAAAS